jgi:ABC-2 type transport system permease protein
MRTEVLAETLRARRRSLAWWAAGVIAFVALNIAFYPSVRDSAGLSDYAKDLPKGLRGLFVGGELDLVSPVGYLNSQVFALTAPMLLLVFAIGAGAAAVAGEEERGTLDLLLAQPLSRASLVWQRFGALVAMVLALCAAVLATVALGALLVDLHIGFDKLVAATGGVALLSVLMGAVALAAGAVLAGRGRAIAIAAGLAIASWMLDGLGQAVDALDSWRVVSPYNQALGKDPLRAGVPWGSWALLAGLSLVVVALGAFGLGRRDVRQ